MTRLIARVRTLAPAEIAALIRASRGVDGDERPWPASLDREDDEALRISATLAARDAAAVLPSAGLAQPTATRAARIVARIGHVTALRHAYPAAVFDELLAPWTASVGGRRSGAGPSTRPGVRRAR